MLVRRRASRQLGPQCQCLTRTAVHGAKMIGGEARIIKLGAAEVAILTGYQLSHRGVAARHLLDQSAQNDLDAPERQAAPVCLSIVLDEPVDSFLPSARPLRENQARCRLPLCAPPGPQNTGGRCGDRQEKGRRNRVGKGTLNRVVGHGGLNRKGAHAFCEDHVVQRCGQGIGCRGPAKTEDTLEGTTRPQDNAQGSRQAWIRLAQPLHAGQEVPQILRGERFPVEMEMLVAGSYCVRGRSGADDVLLLDASKIVRLVELQKFRAGRALPRQAAPAVA